MKQQMQPLQITAATFFRLLLDAGTLNRGPQGVGAERFRPTALAVQGVCPDGRRALARSPWVGIWEVPRGEENGRTFPSRPSTEALPKVTINRCATTGGLL